MHGESKRYVIGGSPLDVRVGAEAAHITIPSGHIDTARKVVDLVGSTLREREIAFTLKQADNTVEFLFGKTGFGRMQQSLDGDILHSVLSGLQEKLPTLEQLEKAHTDMRQSWATKSAAAPAGRELS